MNREERGEDERFYSHELDEDVERWARRVLERVTNGVSDYSRLVRVRSFRTKTLGVVRGASLSL